MTGASSQMLQSVAVNYLQSLGTQQVKQLADSLDSETARAALQGIVGCAGAAAQGSSCAAGASGAAASVVLSNLLESLSGASAAEMTAEEKQQRIDLINSIVVGVTSALGDEASVAGAAARIEAENNSLSVAENQARAAEMRACQDKQCEEEVREKYSEISEQNLSSAEECVGQEDCLAKVHELREWQAEYSQRISDLGEKLHEEGELSSEEWEEIQYLMGNGLLLESSKNIALKNALVAGGGSEEVRQLLVDNLAQVALAGATNAAGVGVIQKGRGDTSSSYIFGQSGVKIPSKTVWRGSGKERIDVENPNPGKRAGQIHYQDERNSKYYYQASRGVFTLDIEGSDLAPRYIQDKLKNQSFLNGINKAMKYLGE